MQNSSRDLRPAKSAGSTPRLRILIAAALLTFMGCPQAQSVGAEQVGTATGLPVPRYVSLKSDRVNLRAGPSKDHRTAWVFQRAGLPVEVTAEFENWRRIRDSEGTEGWVLNSLLSGRRTALVAPWRKGEIIPLYSGPAETSGQIARLEAGVLGSVKACASGWCRIYGDRYDGYVQQSSLWGVYPNEKVN